MGYLYLLHFEMFICLQIIVRDITEIKWGQWSDLEQNNIVSVE